MGVAMIPALAEMERSETTSGKQPRSERTSVIQMNQIAEMIHPGRFQVGGCGRSKIQNACQTRL